MITRIKDKLSKVINIDTKDGADLMDWVSKDKIAYDKVKTIFDDEIVKSADIIASVTREQN